MPSGRSHSLSELVEASGFDRRTIVYYIQSGLLPKVGRRGPHTRYPDECLTRLLFIKGVRNRQSEGQLLTATLAEIRRALVARDSDGIRELLDRGLPVAELTALFAEIPTSPPEPGPEPGPAPLPVAPPVMAPPAPQPVPLADSPRVSQPVSGATGERRSYGLADAGIRKRFAEERPPTPATEVQPEPSMSVPTARDPAELPPQDDQGDHQGRNQAGHIAATTPGSGAETSLAESELGELLRELEVRPTLNARRSPPGSPEQWTEIPITSRVYLSVRGLAVEDAPLAEAVGRLLKRALRARAPSATP